MESEKVKEIKKALEFCTSLKKGCRDCSYSEIGCYRLLKDILTLINELEKENENLKKQFIAIDTLDETNFEKRHKAIMLITEKQLKQFAERLKQEIDEQERFYCDCIDMTYNGLTKDQIDKKLKEFIKGE